VPKKAPADPARFREASDWFRGRVPVTRDEWEQLTVAERRQAFVLAGTQQLEVVQAVFDEIAKAIDNGTAIDAWRKAIKEKLGKRFTEKNATNLTTAFINANQMAYNTGRYWQMNKPEVTKVLKYLRYDAVLDQSTTRVCRSLTGTIRRHDDPWWLTHWPPSHHRCRSAVRALSDRMVKRAGGPTREAPRPDIAGDWGLAPPLRAGAMWHPDLAKYDHHLAREYTRKQESMRARAAKKRRRKSADTELALEAKFASGQPRVPAGSSKGGQWTSGRSGSGSYASPLHDPAHHEAELKAQYGEAASTVAWGRAMEHQGRALTPEQLHESVDALKAAGVDVYDIRTSPMHAKLLKDGHADAGSLIDAAKASANAPKKNPMLADMERKKVAEFEATIAIAAHHRALGNDRAGDIRLDHDVTVAAGARLPHVELRGARADAAAAFGALSHADLKQPTGYRWSADHEDRAFQQGSHINLGAGGTANRHEITSAVMHEWGHAIEERNPERLAKSVAYLQARTKGEPVVKLNTLKDHEAYGHDELAQPDKLHTPFAGKVYEGKGPGGREATELLATTTEHLNNPTKMGRVVAQDKDTFHFVLGQLANQ